AMKPMHTTLAAVALTVLALPLVARADSCKVEISGNDLLQYDKKELAVPATCREITVTLHHVGKQPREAMGHDWVLVKTPDLAAVAQSVIGAGLANNSLVPGDKRVLAHTRVIGGGESTSVPFSASILTR